MKQQKTTHFGFQQVTKKDKANLIAGVFDSVANKYDLMNDLMSLGCHRLWKRCAVSYCGIRAGQTVLDLAGGTGDLCALFAKILGSSGSLILADINSKMIQVGRSKLRDKGIVGNVHYVQADAENLPFPDNHFDLVAMSFGLRNVINKDAALNSTFKVLKPGGRLVILEFSKPTTKILNKLYDAYSFHVLPRLGKLITNDRSSYQYLAESIRMHPNQHSLARMISQAGFTRVNYHNISGGIVALHRGYKF